MTEFGFVIIGGPHGGKTENPTCYARTTQRAKHIRFHPTRLSKATGKLLPPRLTQWARYQDYIDHVRRALPSRHRDTLLETFWPMLKAQEGKVIVDVIAQFKGRRHSDADHVASTIADALFPQAPRRQSRGSRHYRPAWGYHTLKHAPGDGLVLARMLDCRDGADYAFVAVNIHGPYPRDAWLEGNPVKRFPRVLLLSTIPLDDTSTPLRGTQ